MHSFSMYERALKAVGEQAEELGTITHVSRKDFCERDSFRFRASAPVLEYVSLLIENALLLRTHRGGRVYAGFERLSRMEGVADCFLRIADVSERLYVFGLTDWKPPRHPNVRVIGLDEGSPLSRELFVVADSPALHAALVARSESGPAADDERTYYAVKTHDAKAVRELAGATEEFVDRLVFS